jgi:hypothetical protein
VNETEVRQKMLDAAGLNADVAGDENTLPEEAGERAQAARALAEGAAYLAGAPEARRLSAGARVALTELITDGWHEVAERLVVRQQIWTAGTAERVLIELRELVK